MLLPYGETSAALSHLSLVAFMQALYKAVCVNFIGSPADALVRNFRLTQSYIALDRAAEEKDILEDDGEVFSERLQVPLAHVHAVQ